MLSKIPKTIQEYSSFAVEIPEFLESKVPLAAFYDDAELTDGLERITETGVLNAFPLAQFSETLLVSRFYPGKGLNGVGALDLGYSDIVTLSQDGEYWIESLICYLNLSRWGTGLNLNEIEDIVDDYGFPVPEVSKKFFLRMGEIPADQLDFQEVRGALWSLLGEVTGKKFFSHLGRVWGDSPENIVDDDHFDEWAEESPELFFRITAGVWAFSKDFEKLDKLAKWFVYVDDIFDAGYNWHSSGIVSGDLGGQGSMMLAKAYYENQLPFPGDLNEDQVLVWLKFAEMGAEYEGNEHFEYARKIASENPDLAFTYTCNASAYYSLSNRELNQSYFQLPKNWPMTTIGNH